MHTNRGMRLNILQVMGIRDRHQDNMMIKDNKIFFHIDFGFILNDAPGFDAPIFSIPGKLPFRLAIFICGRWCEKESDPLRVEILCKFMHEWFCAVA